MIPEARTWPERCPGCGYHEATQGCACKGTLKFAPGTREKAAGIARATAAASPDERARIDAAIAGLAATGSEWSANDLRRILPNAGGPLMGARFSAAAKAGLIRDTGKRIPSTLASTHAHEVRVWVGAA